MKDFNDNKNYNHDRLTEDFKVKVLAALTEARDRYDGSDANFAKKYGINKTVYSSLKKGETEKKISPAKWLELGRVLGVSLNERKWNMARTDVFNMIEDDVVFCKEFGKSMMFVDECATGKTYSARYLSRTLKNCFYVDASQCRQERAFIKELAVLSVLNWKEPWKISRHPQSIF